jgi:hypothetical protein
MDEGERHNHKQHPSVEVFAAAAAKKHERPEQSLSLGRCGRPQGLNV